MMHQSALASLPYRALIMHHAYPLRVYQSCRFAMIDEFSPDELLTSTGRMHHNDNGHNVIHFLAREGGQVHV